VVPAAHIDNSDLDLYVRQHLDPERTSNIKLHVQNCTVCEDKLLRGMLALLSELNQKYPGATSQELRFEQRVQKGEHGSLQILSPLSFEQSPVEIVDVSKGGFGLITDTFIPSETIVQVRMGTAVTLGEVCYCRRVTRSTHFRTGIQVRTASELQSSSKRSPRSL